MPFLDNAGLGNRNHYGPRAVDDKFGGQVSTSGGVKEVEWVFSFDDLPSAVTGGDMEGYIPAGAVITKAQIQVITAFAGGTSYDIGLEQNDGTAIDLDGLWDLLAVADMNAVNEWSDAAVHGGVNSGTLVDSTVGLAFNGYLVAVATGTYTAGKAKVKIEYREADFDASTRYTAGGVYA